MKIAHIAPINFNIPHGRGGPEQACFNLQEGLIKVGLDATLFGCKNFRSSGKLKYLYPRELNSLAEYNNADRMMRAQMMTMHYAFAFTQARKYDIVQTHIPDWTLPFVGMDPKIPIVIKCSNRFNPFIKKILSAFYRPNLHLVCISQTQRVTLPPELVKKSVIIHECIDTDHIKPQYKKEDFFLFVGRLIEWKQPHVALRAAIRAKKKLVVIGTAPHKDTVKDFAYYQKKVKPLLAHKLVQYIPEVPHKKMFDYYRRAKAVIFPTNIEEPFGLVFIEALACGTPIVGSDNAHAREIVGDKKISLLGRSVQDISRMLTRVDSLNPKDCRLFVEKHYSRTVIALKYKKLYEKVLRH